MVVIICVCIISYVLTCVESALEGKIVGGRYPTITEFPHVAFLAIQCELKREAVLSRWICGSTILNQRLLLTAAHCVEECSSKSWISVSVGHVNVQEGLRSSASRYAVHEDYYWENTINDIGLVIVNTPLKFSWNVKRVVLLEKPPYDEPAQVAGWGIIDEQYNKTDPKLKSIDQHVWKTKDCINILKSIPPGTFCASSKNKNDYASGGDSGNGLVVRGYIQIGLVSYRKLGKLKNVIVYTDVGFFYKWIQKTAQLLWC